jgi:hypothetical protein
MIALPSTKSETGGELSVKYDKGKSTMVLSTTKRDVLLSVSYISFRVTVSANGFDIEFPSLQATL